MVVIARIPLSRITSIYKGRVVQQRDAAVLITSPGQWHFSAEAVFELPGIDSAARAVKVRLEVDSGQLGIGWLDAGGSDWVARAMIPRTAAPIDVALVIPEGTAGGRLVIDNATEGDRAAVAVIVGIDIATVALRDGAGEDAAD